VSLKLSVTYGLDDWVESSIISIVLDGSEGAISVLDRVTSGDSTGSILILHTGLGAILSLGLEAKHERNWRASWLFLLETARATLRRLGNGHLHAVGQLGGDIRLVAPVVWLRLGELEVQLRVDQGVADLVGLVADRLTGNGHGGENGEGGVL